MAADATVSGFKTGPFSSKDRIRARSEYQAIYRACAPIYTARLVFYARPAVAGVRRLGCTIPKKTGCAVERNRLRRLIREVFRLERSALPDGCDLVVNAKRGASDLDYGSVREAFLKVCARLAQEGFLSCVR
ncbi:MAG: ribonuclease P protein component [Acidobacteria bacterium]|jgi:ribonuclease P protein component|nr:ribonuclease P protein component [Acidobacteriota bacterium]